MKCSRRNFIKGSLLLPFVLPQKARGDLFGLPLDCFSCSLGICFCGTPPRPAIKAKYWFPVGFLEGNKECEFLTSLIPIVGSFLSPLLSRACSLVPFVIEGNLVQNYPTTYISQDYMRVHARWYALPKQLQEAIQTLLLVVHGCPCIGIQSLFESIMDIDIVKKYTEIAKKIEAEKERLLRPIKEVERRVREEVRRTLSPITQRFEKFLGGLSGSESSSQARRFLQVVAQAQDYIPFWFTEPFSPIWLVDLLSPDQFTANALASAIVSAIQAQAPPLGLIMCPFLTDYLTGHGYLRNIADLDPSFICVGLWGKGYPRIGVVRHDDPYVAILLALSRFHHLFSKTFPVIKPEFTMNPGKMKYQILYPFKTECFRIGYWGVPDPYDLKDISRAKTLLKRTLPNPSIAKSPSSLLETVRKTVAKGRRRTFVAIWYKQSKCCC